MTGRWLIGAGLASNADPAALLDLAAELFARQGWPQSRVAALATLDRKADAAAVRMLAAAWAVPVIGLTAAALVAQQGRLATPSVRVRRHVGLDGVAEASALALAGPGGCLVQPKLAGRRVTLAVAMSG